MTSSTKLNSTGSPTELLSGFAFVFINGPLVTLSFVANIFFAFCILTPHKTQRVKQPLKTLMGFVISSTILYLFCLTLMYLIQRHSFVVNLTFWFIVVFMVHVNMTSCVWLMFYYYIMIVPSQRALFIWVKKNIKSVIYVVLFFDRSLFFVCVSSQMLVVLTARHDNGTIFPLNESNMFNTVTIAFKCAYIFFCLCVMMVSSFATAHYLYKHMKSLAASGGSLFNPRLRSQIRVTVTGILQGVLYFLYALWFMVTMLCYYNQQYVLCDSFINYTVISLYISGTTINLGVGQTLFRERAVHVWKAVKKRLGTGKTSEDPRPPGNQLTSLATIESTGVDAVTVIL